MSPFSVRESLAKRPSRAARSGLIPAGRSRFFVRPRVEQLESRTLLSRVYTNSFDTGVVGSEWSRQIPTDVTPVGARRFLGQFSNDTVSLSLSGLAPHTDATVSFDLYLINSWDGNSNVYGPDRWSLGVQGGPTLLDTTFSNVSSENQAYPDAYPVGNYPARTGASESNSLGYGGFGDTVYHITETFAHSAGSLVLNFAENAPAFDTESWGIDNVSVKLAGGTIIAYANTFESGFVGPEWTRQIPTEVTPVGARRFLGRLAADTVSLQLQALPAHTQATVSFDLFVIQSWDGNAFPGQPDVWDLSVRGGPTLLHTTFSNAFPSDPVFVQSYPGTYPSDTYPGLTGATEEGTLGYPKNAGYAGVADSVYHITFTFAHSASGLILDFARSPIGIAGLSDESWGLDNVSVAVDTKPYASTVLADHPTAFWRLGESTGTAAYDSSGDGWTGTYFNGVVQGQPGAIPFDPNAAPRFDGVNDHVEFSNPAGIGDDFTVEAWVKTAVPSLTGSQAYQGNGIVWSDVAGVQNDWIVAILNNRLSFFTGNPDLTVTGNTPINDGKWHYIVATRVKGGTKSLYVDGFLDGTGPTGGNTLRDNPLIEVGGNTLDSRYFNGNLDEVALYPYALSASQVTAHYQAAQLALRFTVQPPAVVGVGQSFEVQTSVTDAFGNLDTDFNGSVAISLANNPGGAVLGGTVTVNAANGVADFTDLTLNQAGAGYTLQAAIAGINPVATGSFSVTRTIAAWVPLGPAPINNGQVPGGNPVSGRITGLATDPSNANIIYAASAGGGVWKTVNGGMSWVPLTDNVTDAKGNPVVEFMGAVALGTDPTTGKQILYAGTGEANNTPDTFYGEGILVSTDGGQTWTLRDANGAFQQDTISKIAVDPTNPCIVYAAVNPYGANSQFNNNGGIWKSIDGGKTWVNVTAAAGLATSEEWSDVVIEPNTPMTLYAAQGSYRGAPRNGVYKSIDGGMSWSLLNEVSSGSQDGRIALAVYDDGVTQELLVSIAHPYDSNNPFGAQFFKMFLIGGAGQTLTDLTANVPPYMGGTDPQSHKNYGQGHYDTSLAIDPSHPNTFYAGGSSNGGTADFIQSTDGGTTWHDIQLGANGSSGIHSDDHAIAFDALGRLVDGNDGGVYRLDNPTFGSIQWTSLNTNLQITQFTGVALDPTNANVAYGGSQDNGTEKFNGALAWNETYDGDGGFVRVDSTCPTTVYTEKSDTSIARSTDGGQNWTPITGTISGQGNFYEPYVLDPSNSQRLLLGTDGVWESTNQGDSWTEIGMPGINGFPTQTLVDSIAIAASAPLTIYVSTGGQAGHYDLYRTTDGGATWSDVSIANTGRIMSLAVDATASTTLYAVVGAFSATPGKGLVYKSTDGGAAGTWTDITGNLPNFPTNSIALEPLPGSPGKDVVFVGDDLGVYGSCDDGKTWAAVGSGMPHAQVADLEYSPTLGILAAGTHGRGLWEILVNPASIVLAASANPALVNQVVTFTCTVSATGATPTGTVTFLNGGTILGTVPLDATGTARLDTSFSTAGVHDVIASYSGDTQFSPCATTVSPSINALTGQNLQSALDQQSAVAFQADSNADLNNTLAAVNSLGPQVSAAAVQVMLGPGSYTDVSASPPASASLAIVGNGTTTTIVGQSPALTVASGNVTVTGVIFTTATDAPTVLVTGGKLVLRDDTVEESTGYIDAAITLTGGVLDLGTFSDPGGNILDVNGAGEFVRCSNPNAVSAAGNTFEINGVAQAANALSFTTLSTSAATSIWGQSVTLTATVQPDASGSGPPTGTVTFLDGSTFLGTEVLQVANGVAQASFTTSSLQVGSHAIQALYGGGGNFLASTSSSVPLQVVYNFSGFEIPYLTALKPGTKFGLGSTVSLEFQLHDAAGNLLSDLSDVVSLQAAVVHSDGSVGAPFTPASLSNKGLFWDKTNDHFNWVTTGLSAGTYELILTLADGTVNTTTVQLVSRSGTSAETAAIDGGGTSGSAQGLLLGDLYVYVSDPNGLFTADEQARIQDAVAGLDQLLAPYHVTITEVSDPAAANLVLDTGTASACGTAADGVLGCFDGAAMEVTLLQGWDWYAGSDPGGIAAGQYDFETVVLHELGHSLGLGHSSDPGSVMSATLDDDTARRTMTVADLNVADTDGGGADGLHAGSSLALAPVGYGAAPRGMVGVFGQVARGSEVAVPAFGNGADLGFATAREGSGTALVAGRPPLAGDFAPATQGSHGAPGEEDELRGAVEAGTRGRDPGTRPGAQGSGAGQPTPVPDGAAPRRRKPAVDDAGTFPAALPTTHDGTAAAVLQRVFAEFGSDADRERDPVRFDTDGVALGLAVFLAGAGARTLNGAAPGIPEKGTTKHTKNTKKAG